MIKTRDTLIHTRKNKGITQAQLAQEVNISRAYLSNIELGKHTPSIKVAQKICKVLNKPFEDLFF